MALLPWQGHLAVFVKRHRFLGKLIALRWQSHCASLAESLRFVGRVTALRWRCHCASGGSEARCWFLVRGIAGKCSAVRGGVWLFFFTSWMLVGRFGETACWRFLPYWRSVRNLEKRESDASENTNETPRKLKMKCFENCEWSCVIPYE